LRINSSLWSRRVKISCSNHSFLSSSQKLVKKTRFKSISSISQSIFFYESIYLVFLCQLVSLLQEQITIDLINKVNHSIVSLLQERIMIDLVNKVSHSIVSLLQRYKRDKLCYMRVVETNRQWVCFKDAFDIDLIIESVTQ